MNDRANTACIAALGDRMESGGLAGSTPAADTVSVHAAADVDAARRSLPSPYTPSPAPPLHSHDARSS